MGGSSFDTMATGKNAKEAYHNAVEDANYEYGHRGYTGQINVKDGFIMVSTEVMTKEQAQNYADELYNKDDKRALDKWGPACCIELAEKSDTGEKMFYFFGVASS